MTLRAAGEASALVAIEFQCPTNASSSDWTGRGTSNAQRTQHACAEFYGLHELLLLFSRECRPCMEWSVWENLPLRRLHMVVQGAMRYTLGRRGRSQRHCTSSIRLQRPLHIVFLLPYVDTWCIWKHTGVR
eukprot:GHVU01102084.1.p2 GENE.GHVU01102084.1~~GHVU01102084.1.p2  ORF type:complete len:131 (+),score=4.06 GHVU01102084.1:511-903(+)